MADIAVYIDGVLTWNTEFHPTVEFVIKTQDGLLNIRLKLHYCLYQSHPKNYTDSDIFLSVSVILETRTKLYLIINFFDIVM